MPSWTGHRPPPAFGHAHIDITVGGITTHHLVEANDTNGYLISRTGNLAKALCGDGEWHYHFHADDETTDIDSTRPQRYSYLDIDICAGEVVVRTSYMWQDRESRIPIRPHWSHHRAIKRAIRDMTTAASQAFDHNYGECMDCMFDN